MCLFCCNNLVICYNYEAIFRCLLYPKNIIFVLIIANKMLAHEIEFYLTYHEEAS